MKSSATFSIDSDLLMEIREKKINVSALVEQFFRDYLEIPVDKTIQSRAEIDQAISKIRANLTKLENKKKEADEKLFGKHPVTINC